MSRENLDKQITENVPEFFFIWDLTDRKMIYLTSGFQELATVALKDRPRYDRVFDFVHPDDRPKLETLLGNLSIEHPHHDIDLKINDKKYNAKWLNIKTFPIEPLEGEIHRIVGHITDITNKITQIDSLEKLNEKTKNTIYILAHDLKNPLVNINMLASMAKEALVKQDHAQLNTFLGMISKIGNEADELIRSMLDLMELNTDEIRLEAEEMDLVKVLRASTERFAPQLERYGIQLVEQYPSAPIFTEIDIQKFNHITNNLLSNAIKFTPSGHKITITAEDNGDIAMFCITDTGIGIAEEKKDQLFNEFSGARRKGLRGEKSTGLGLSIVHRIVALHKGKIKVWSEVGKGSSFIIFLPK